HPVCACKDTALIVMPGLDPGVDASRAVAWIAGSSPAMTRGWMPKPLSLMDVPNQLQHLDGAGSQLLRKLVLEGLRLLDEPGFIDVLDEFHTHFLEPRHRVVLEAKSLVRHRAPDL